MKFFILVLFAIAATFGLRKYIMGAVSLLSNTQSKSVAIKEIKWRLSLFLRDPNGDGQALYHLKEIVEMMEKNLITPDEIGCRGYRSLANRAQIAFGRHVRNFQKTFLESWDLEILPEELCLSTPVLNGESSPSLTWEYASIEIKLKNLQKERRMFSVRTRALLGRVFLFDGTVDNGRSGLCSSMIFFL